MQEILTFDHIDTRVRSIAEVEPFYDRFMPAIGWTGKSHAHVDTDGEWRDVDEAHPANAVEYYAPRDGVRAPNFIGFIEHVGMQPSRTRIAFSVINPVSLVEWEPKLREFGARNIERSEDMDGYPALFFGDPAGTRLELVRARFRPLIPPRRLREKFDERFGVDYWEDVRATPCRG